MRPIIHSKIHRVQQSRSSVATVATVIIDLVDSVAVQNVNQVDEIVEGSGVKAVFVELWLLDDGNDGSFAVGLFKAPSGVANPTFAQTQALNNWENKKNILYFTQGLSPNDGIGNPVPIIRQWFKVPKGKQRFGLGDKLNLFVSNMGLNDLNFCGHAIYKEYS